MDWQRRDATFKASIELANRIAAAFYEIGSFLESAKLHPNRIDALYEAHETRMKDLMPPVVAAHVAVAAQDYELFKRFSPITNEISEFDRCVTVIYREMDGPRRAYALDSVLRAQSNVLSALPTRVYEVASNGKPTVTIQLGTCLAPKELSGKP